MKVLIKTKSPNVVLVIPGTTSCVDYDRFRVRNYVPEMERWETRGLVEIKRVRDDATDEMFLSFWKKDKATAFTAFYKRFSLSGKPVVEEKAPVVEEKVEEVAKEAVAESEEKVAEPEEKVEEVKKVSTKKSYKSKK